MVNDALHYYKRNHLAWPIPWTTICDNVERLLAALEWEEDADLVHPLFYLESMHSFRMPTITAILPINDATRLHCRRCTGMLEWIADAGVMARTLLGKRPMMPCGICNPPI